MLRDFSGDNFDIIIAAGQSNCKGFGHGDVSDPFEHDDRIYFLGRDMIISPGTEAVTGNIVTGNFPLIFAREYIRRDRLAEGRKILILRAALGNTGFKDKRWTPEGDLYRDLYDMMNLPHLT